MEEARLQDVVRGWPVSLGKGLVFNALDGAKKLGISSDELGKKYDTLKKGEDIIKLLATNMFWHCCGYCHCLRCCLGK